MKLSPERPETVTYLEVAAFFVSLLEKSENIKNDLPYPDRDIRTMFLNNTIGLLQPALMSMNILTNWALSPGKSKDFQGLIGIICKDKKSVETVCNAVKIYHKAATLTLIMFQLENTLRRLSKELNISPERDTFYHISKKIIEELDFPERDHLVLQVLAAIRNSSHNNGVYKGVNDLDVEVNGRAYQLRVDEKVSIFGWGDFYNLLSEMLSIYHKITKHERVLALTEDIVDEYIACVERDSSKER